MTVVVKVHRLRGRAVITHTAGLAIVLAAVAAAGPSAPVISASTIASGSVVAAPAVRVDQRIGVPSILAGASVSVPTIAAGAVSVAPAGIVSTSAVSAPTVTAAGSVTIAPATVASSALVNAPTLSAGAVDVAPAPIASTTAVRAPVLAVGAVSITPAAIPSAAVMRAPAVAPGAVVLQPASIASVAALYAPSVALQGATYDGDAQRYFDAMTVQPAVARKSLISDLIAGLKADGAWARMRGFWLLAAHDAQAARINAFNPMGGLLAEVNSPIFTIDRGFQGDGNSSYLDTGMTFAGSQDSAALGFWSRSLAPASGYAMGNNNAALQARNTSDATTWRLMSAGNTTTAGTTTGVGLFIINRNSPNSRELYQNTTLRESVASSSQAPDTSASIRILGRSGIVSFWPGQSAFSFISTGLTAGDIAAINNRVSTFLTAIGAA